MKNKLALILSILLTGTNVNAKDSHDLTPLHQAAENGHKDVVQLLLQNGANVNAQDKYGMTPLHCAAKYGYVGAAKKLIEYGADVNAKDNDGMTPLRYAEKNGKVADLLGKAEKYYSQIKKCMLSGKKSEIDSLHKNKDLLCYIATLVNVGKIKTLDDLYFALFSFALTSGEDGSLAAYFDHFDAEMVQFCEHMLKKENNTENNTQQRLAKIWQEYRKHHKKDSPFAKKVFKSTLPAYYLNGKTKLPSEIVANVIIYL